MNNEISYLKDNLGLIRFYNPNLLNSLKEKEIIVYYSNTVCTSCLEKLLFILDNDYNLASDTKIVTNDSSNVQVLESINDIFQLNYDYHITDSEDAIITSDILIFIYNREVLKSILNFNPAEISFFKKHFENVISF